MPVSAPVVQSVNATGLVEPRGTYSHITLTNGIAYISGQLPLTGDGTPVTTDTFAAQTQQTLANLDACLTTIGITREQLLHVRVYLTDMTQWQEFDDIYSAWIGAHRPARAVAGINALHYGAALEIEATAAAPTRALPDTSSAPEPGIPVGNAPGDTIVILTTGGTIDKYYSPAGELDIGDPAIGRILDDGLVTYPILLEPVLRKDSLDLTDADRELITGRVVEGVDQGRTRFVITHGTDTMTDTAAHLDSGRAGRTATIVLTGAMQPACMSSTDADLNVGLALAAVQLLPPGVYICMNGRVFPAAGTIKDRRAGRFLHTKDNHPRS